MIRKHTTKPFNKYFLGTYNVLATSRCWEIGVNRRDKISALVENTF